LSNSASPDSVREIRDFLAAELERFRAHISSDQWQTLLVGVSDQGEIKAFPCRLVLPFHYPATVAELDALGPDHFEFPDSPLKLDRRKIPEFAEQYAVFTAMNDEADAILASERHKQRRVNLLREACATFNPTLTVFGIESDSEAWWEVNTFQISGPRIPQPPVPVSDIQLLARLCHHTHSYVGQGRFKIEDGAIVEVGFDGADTTDATIDLLRGVPRLSELLGKLKKMCLKSTLVTERSLKFLARELPHVEILHSHHFDQ
jgi:hypothetical protein